MMQTKFTHLRFDGVFYFLPTKLRTFQRARAIGRQYFLGDQSKISFERCFSNQI